MDEAGFDNREDYAYGCSPRGERCLALKCGRKRERVSWISALKSGKILAPLTFKGCCNRELFENWLAKSLLPKLKPGTLIILDNASFHKGESIRELVEAAGCELWYLPAYSPNLNKIDTIINIIPKIKPFKFTISYGSLNINIIVEKLVVPIAP